ncbi:TetR/AcrR family transcriptional regulator [Actinoalloteichus hymeniacidonis]|uniref:TetR/AcrR family transcriptional regulator n=1 Tax=Actinoalloteichus hymeniacidonis TaxID=340345 RepID=UPI0017E1E0C0|nr:TetR/AcrR family transcriptional regulator [Actinoalloteichus hymeniacidonis]MBB5907681.1 AcrR family transcriptional regulator [Actinoalloteichus hymeniacidonis]
MAEALLTVIARDGLAGAKLASVAAEAGTSIGLVQSYFRSKSDLLRFGIEYMYARAAERIAEAPRGTTIRQTLISIMETLLPLDEARRGELSVWLAFIPVTLTDPAMRALHHHNTERLLSGLTDGFARAQQTGELPSRLDPREEASALVALTDGISVHCLATGGDFDAARARRLLTNHLDRLFTEGSDSP